MLEPQSHSQCRVVAYGDERQKSIRLQQPYQEKEGNIIGELLLGSNIEETKETIDKLENHRKENETTVTWIDHTK